MFQPKTAVTDPEYLNDITTQITAKIATATPGTPEYTALLKQLAEVHNLRIPHKEPKTVSPDALVAAGSSLLGIAAILSFERVHVVATKALGLVTKVKI